MSGSHGNSRRQAYGRRMKDVRTRRNAELPVDLDGPAGWSRGTAWEDERRLPPALELDQPGSSARHR